MSERLVSRKSIEIAPAVLLSEDAQPLRPDHLDLVAPLIEVPRHFKPTRSMEADDEAAVVLRLGNLLWVEAELGGPARRSEEHTSELQSLMRISYAVFCLKKKNQQTH